MVPQDPPRPTLADEGRPQARSPSLRRHGGQNFTFTAA